MRENKNLIVRVLAGALATGLIVPTMIGAIEDFLPSPTKPIEKSMDSFRERKLEDYAIIFNGIGNADFYSEKGQRDSVQAAFEAYNLLAQKIKPDRIQLFLSNPYKSRPQKMLKWLGRQQRKISSRA